MATPIRILLQTTIPTTEDDWDIKRFSLLRDYLASLKNETGHPLCEVTARDRQDAQGNTIGRAVAESSFHHFLDYNWDTEMGCPSFVEEPPGDGMKQEPRALQISRLTYTT